MTESLFLVWKKTVKTLQNVFFCVTDKKKTQFGLSLGMTLSYSGQWSQTCTSVTAWCHLYRLSTRRFCHCELWVCFCLPLLKHTTLRARRSSLRDVFAGVESQRGVTLYSRRSGSILPFCLLSMWHYPRSPRHRAANGLWYTTSHSRCPHHAHFQRYREIDVAAAEC